MPTVLVNVAEWSAPEPIPADWAIANAPRPIDGDITWTGDFRHGVIYAASPHIRSTWKADDAWLVEFIDNAEVERRVQAKLDEHGLTLADTFCTMAEVAADFGLPYVEQVTS